MSEWKECKLGDVAELINGFAFKSTDFSDIGVPVIKIKNVASGKLLLNGIQFYPYEITDKLKPFVLKKSDILIAMTGSHVHQPSSMVGRVTRYDRPFIALLNQRVGKIVSRQLGILNEDFIYYFLKQEDVTIDLAVNAGGSANQANVSSEQIRNLPIFLPPISEQHAIAGVLSSLDDKIDLLHRQNKTLEGMAEALWRKMFVEEADPGWKKGKLGDITSVSTGKGLKRIEYNENGLYPVIGANGEIGRTDKYLTNERLILTGRVGTLGEIFISNKEVWISDNVLIIKPNENRFFYAVYFLLKNIDFENLNVGSTQPLVTQTDLKNIEIEFPSNGVLDYFTTWCESAFNKIEQNVSQIRTLSRLRNTLLPKLMSGEVRVK